MILKFPMFVARVPSTDVVHLNWFPRVQVWYVQHQQMLILFTNEFQRPLIPSRPYSKVEIVVVAFRQHAYSFFCLFVSPSPPCDPTLTLRLWLLAAPTLPPLVPCPVPSFLVVAIRNSWSTLSTFFFASSMS